MAPVYGVYGLLFRKSRRRRPRPGSDSVGLRKGGTMGEPNNVLNVYMNRPDRIRSVLEYYLEQKLPEDWTFEEEEGFYSTRNAKGKISSRQRDRIKKVRAAGFSFLLGLENQYSVNLIYPWRLMELDCRAYGLQIDKLQEKNAGGKTTYEGGDDFKYRYKKEDRLDPVLNLTLYWGKKRWERPLSLGEMTTLRTLPLKLCQLFGDYRVHLISMRSIPEEALREMDSDLKYVLGLMKRTRSRKKYETFILENREYFSRIPKSAIDVIDVCTNIGNIRKYLQFETNERGEEEADMCKALNEIEKHAEKRGKRQGISQGISQGETRLASLIHKLAVDGRTEDIKLAATDETARKHFYREYGIA